jgi:hypothetical protein
MKRIICKVLSVLKHFIFSLRVIVTLGVRVSTDKEEEQDSSGKEDLE